MSTMTLPIKKLGSNTVLAQNLLLARMAVDWTQHTLAALSGVSRATIAQIEAGIGDPRLSTIELLAAALGVPTAVLLFGKLEIRGIARLVLEPPTARQELDAGTLSTLEYLAGSGSPKNRLEAARIGIAWVQQQGHQEQAHAVGAALGAARYPAEGILVNAHLAHIMMAQASGEKQKSS